jgi:uncharacterized protein with HEPN domain
MIQRDLILLKDIRAAAYEALDALSKFDDISPNLQYLIYRTWERSLEIIGEAASKISDETKNLNIDVNWREMTAMRNFIIHQYHQIEAGIIATTIKVDLPILVSQIEKIISKIENN